MSKIIDTITTLIGVGVIGLFAYTVLWPKIKDLKLPAPPTPQAPQIIQIPIPSPQQQQQQPPQQTPAAPTPPPVASEDKGFEPPPKPTPPPKTDADEEKEDESGDRQTTNQPTPSPPATQGAPTGMTLGFKTTGQKVAMQDGADHENGKRYQASHRFTNYLMSGIFKIGQGQQVIEMKTDGPCHGCQGNPCEQLPMCTYLEPKFNVNTGRAALGGEWPHPDNHDNLPCPSCKSIPGSYIGKQIGYAVAAYQTGQYRTVEMYVDPTGTGTQWKLLLRETDKGQITSPQQAIRKLPLDFREGLVAQIRMHGATSGDTTMSNAFVYEIVPPASAMYASQSYLYNRFYHGRRM